MSAPQQKALKMYDLNGGPYQDYSIFNQQRLCRAQYLQETIFLGLCSWQLWKLDVHISRKVEIYIFHVQHSIETQVWFRRFVIFGV